MTAVFIELALSFTTKEVQMKKIIALLLVANSALAQEIVIINNSRAVSNSDVSVVSDVKTDGYGRVYEICYRGMLFLKHSGVINQTGGLTQVLDPANGKPIQCVVKE